MDTGRIFLILFLSLFLGLAAGCKKSAPTEAESVAPPPERAPQKARDESSISSLHWLGKKRLATETNATSFIGIWNMPESAKLETYALDKLSTAPWRLLRGETNAAKTASNLLRPLLDDLIQEESYSEVRYATNQPAEFVLAIRLDEPRAALWDTNLAAVLESLTAIRPAPSAHRRSGWSLKKQQSPNLIELARVGEWTVVGAAQGTNTSFGDMLRTIERDRAPFPSPAAHHWLEANLDMARVTEVFAAGWKPPQNTPRITLKVTGIGENVRAEGELHFPKPLPFEIEPWNIPTNLMSGHVMGFTAIQGIRLWLAALESSFGLQVGPPPNQIFLWSLEGLPARAYFAAPLTDASNHVHRLAGRLMDALNPSLAASENGKIDRMDNPSGASWQGMPFLAPFIWVLDANGVKFAFGGTLTNVSPADPLPAELLQSILSRTNLVYYDWEFTGPRIETGLYIGQLLRMVFGKPQIPLDSVSIAWLLAAESRLGNSGTVVTKSGPSTLSFVRTSSVGFTAIELQLLADWLESPQFPRGLHTLLAPPDAPPTGQSPTPAAPAKQ